jgi:hypothetical protein
MESMPKVHVGPAWPGLACLVLALACSEHASERTISEKRVTSEAPRAVVANATNEMRFPGMPGGMPSGGMHAPEEPSGSVTYDVPTGWRERPSTQMRYADFQLGDDPRAECYLSILPGEAGGMAANVNRWRGQMGLAPITEREVELLPKRPILGRDATLVELVGEFSGMSGDPQPDFALLGAIFSVPEGTLFVKMTGPREVVARERGGFDAFCASLSVVRPDDGDAHGPHDGHDHGAEMPETQSATAGSAATGGATDVAAATRPPSSSGGGFAWEAPEGWRTGPHRATRVVTFLLGAGGATECYVSVLGGDGGGVEPNLDRWRDQLGLAPFTPAEFASLPTVEVLGVEAAIFEGYGTFSGMGSDERGDAGVLGIVCPQADSAVFVKMVGSSDDVRAQRENFLRFCRSLRRS